MKRQKARKSGEPGKPRSRILIFDIIRIICIAVIVYDHFRLFWSPAFNALFFADGMAPGNIYSAGLPGYAVYGLILVSGAVLEYNYQGIEKLHGYLQFLFRRFIRIYPAFWMSLIFGLILTPALLWTIKPGALLFEFTGFMVIFGQGNINSMGWFVGTIILLYILFPWFSKIMRKYGLAALVGFCALSWGLRAYTVTIPSLGLFWRWFPLCNAFEFCLGIYIIQTGFYPKNETRSRVIRGLSDVTYYVFLFNALVIQLFAGNQLINGHQNPLLVFDNAIAGGNVAVQASIYYFQMMAGVLAISWVAMKIDGRIQRWIMQRDGVRAFLKS